MLFVLLALGTWWRLAAGGPDEAVATFARPDGAYRVVVVRRSRWPAVMPGQAGDAPGMVRLVDRRGAVLREEPVAMVQLVEQVRWEPGSVHIKGVTDWALPEAPGPATAPR